MQLFNTRRRASLHAFPRRAWEREKNLNISRFLVPTLCVGMHASTLCVEFLKNSLVCEMQNKITLQKRIALTHVIMDILENWRVKAVDQIKILDLPKGTRSRALRRYHENTPLPNASNVMERVEHLLAISEALRTTYPHNSEMGTYWINQAHRRFENRSPLNTIIEDGLDGLMSVRVHLDCAYAWSLTDVK
ncbi:hypothetical protein THIOM_004341 [Candidatus Thiomargarita nelsonii]|uniref:Antitoxin Xre/MbcA/ParS-like toxin-binding domain-containing protein n=1 Tax=Candidatus Thiomargarita nelsonii TaxID=1003181 RepID=A0A176RW71_9GAMM|nr:hypothetical protein THIOM_004341 [Candidatus Thiomargarita nelsonii]